MDIYFVSHVCSPVKLEIPIKIYQAIDVTKMLSNDTTCYSNTCGFVQRPRTFRVHEYSRFKYFSLVCTRSGFFPSELVFTLNK